MKVDQPVGQPTPWTDAEQSTADRRLGGRIVAMTVVLVVVAAGLAITSVRRDAADARSAETTVTDVRVQLAALESLAWQGLTLGDPDFTVQRQTRLRSARMRASAARLVRVLPQEASRRVRLLDRSLRIAVADTQHEIAAGRLTAARSEVQLRVSGSSQVLDGDLARDAVMLRARAERADRRAGVGTLSILALAGVLILALVGASRRGRRAAEARRRRSLAGSEQRFRSLVQKASDVVVVLDASLRIVYVTDAVHAIVGRTPSELAGTDLVDLVGAADRRRLRASMQAVLEGRPRGRPSEWTVVDRMGRLVPVEAVATNLLADEAVGGIVLNLRDVSERRAMEDQLRHQAFHDPLTGLANRALFDDRVGQALLRGRRRVDHVGVLLIDVDDFKMVNDRRGHGTGDRVLRDVARALEGHRRANDTVARLGGDEFAVLVEGVQDHAQLETVAARILRAIGEVAVPPDSTGRLSASIGAVVATSATAGTDDLLRDADIALYSAKARGKGRAEVFHGQALDHARRQLRLRHELAGVAERGELEVHYQPLVELVGGEISGVEALVRWRHPELGMIAPGDFIPLAEETGHICSIGGWVLEQACRDLQGWRADGLGGELSIGVNVSAIQFAREDFVDEVLRTVAAHAVDPRHLVIELTESALIDDAVLTRQRLAALRGAGVKISLDDFGTGYSSLSYLREIDVDSVKIDRSFIERIDERPQDATLVGSIIELGHRLGLRMVAEGIERQGQLLRLQESGCDLGQGYHLARPAPARDTTKRLRVGAHDRVAAARDDAVSVAGAAPRPVA